MAKSFNQVILIGNLTQDPEMKSLPSGQSVASFGMATNRSWTNADGERQDQADFHNIVAWGKLAELCSQYLGKGRKAMIVGRLQTRTWDGEDGKKNYKTEVVASDVTFLDAPGTFGENAAPASAGSKSKSSDKSEDVVVEDVGDDPVDLSEIPF